MTRLKSDQSVDLDHFALIFNLSFQSPGAVKRTITYRNRKSVDISILRSDIAKAFDGFITQDPESAVKSYNSVLKDIVHFQFFSEKYMQLSQAHVVTHIYTLCIIIVIWDSPGVLANRKSWRFKLKIHHIIFSTQFSRALISKVKIRNDAVADFKGADRGPKFISSTEILYEVLRVVIYCQNWQNVILY